MTSLPTIAPVRHRSRGRRALGLALAILAAAGIGGAGILARSGSAVTERWAPGGEPQIRLRVFQPASEPPARGYPLVLFNPGWRSSMDAYSAHLRRLAEGGYAVLGVERSEASMAWQGDLDLTSDAAFDATLERADRAAREGAGEMSRLLDRLAVSGLDGLPLDLGRVGISGHSFGGAMAVEAALSDPRIRAAVNIDGWLFAGPVATLVPAPVLTVTNTASVPAAEDLAAADPVRRHEAVLNARDAGFVARQSARPDAELVEIPKAGHGAFIAKDGGRGLVERLATLVGLRRDIPGITDRAIKAFFDRNLAPH